MDLESIEKLVQFMERHGLADLEIKDGEFEFKASRGGENQVVAAPPTVMMPQVPGMPIAAQPGPAPASSPSEGGSETSAASGNLKDIKCPIVGTFYRKPDPDSDPFVDVGEHVEKGTTVCIVEAMKVMNEIKAEFSGIVREALVEDANPVEFDQPLFRVEPD